MIINHYHIRAHDFILHLYDMVGLYDFNLYLFYKITVYFLKRFKTIFKRFFILILLVI